MIDEIDRRLKDWATAVTQSDEVSLFAPNDSTQGISLFLMDLGCEAPGRGSSKAPLSVSLRYLVSVAAKDAIEGHRLLWELLVDSMRKADRNDWVVEPDGPPLGFWTALKALPRPAFILKVPAWYEWPAAGLAAPMVKSPMVVDAQPLMRLRGTVVSNGHKMMGALVVLGDNRLPNVGDSSQTPVLLASKLIPAIADHPRTYSDADGRFEFSLPAGPRAPRWLLIRAKGNAQIFPFDPANAGTDLNLEINQKET